jgi:hypothetical protein
MRIIAMGFKPIAIVIPYIYILLNILGLGFNFRILPV